jgi:hypothetical protein
MNEIQFLVRRILKEGYDYATKEHEGRLQSRALTIYRYTAQIQLLDHLEKEFLEGNQNDKQD